MYNRKSVVGADWSEPFENIEKVYFLQKIDTIKNYTEGRDNLITVKMARSTLTVDTL